MFVKIIKMNRTFKRLLLLLLFIIIGSSCIWYPDILAMVVIFIGIYWLWVITDAIIN